MGGEGSQPGMRWATLTDCETDGLFEENKHLAMGIKIKDRQKSLCDETAGIPSGDHTGTQAKGPMTTEGTYHPWHYILA